MTTPRAKTPSSQPSPLRGEGWARGKRLVVLLTLFFIVSLVVLAWLGIQTRLSQPEMHAYIEAKAGEILKSKVKIAKIRYQPPTRLVLQGIQVSQGEESGRSFSIAEIDRLTLGFSILNFIRNDYTVPSTLIMDSPQIRLYSEHFPFPFIDSVASAKGAPAKLIIRGGEFCYPWGSREKELILSKVRFTAVLNARSQVRLTLDSKLNGIARGEIRAKGVTDPKLRHYQLETSLDDVAFLEGSLIPLKKINGNVRMTEQKIEFMSLTSLFHGWDIEWRGKVEDWQGEPKIQLDVSEKKGKFPFELSLLVDFETQRLDGFWSWLERTYPFKGKIVQDGKKIRLGSLEVIGYTGRGEIDRSTGDYHILFFRENRRFRVHSNLNQPTFKTEFQLDHASINDMDWVVLGQAFVSPLPKKIGEPGMRFRIQLQTEYVIVEYTPFQDLKGSFDVGTEGIDTVDLRWGYHSHLTGRILFKGGEPRTDLVLRMEEIALDSIKQFAGRPLPENLRGTLEGKLKLRGELKRPEIDGYFTIKNGAIEKLDFDRAIVQFQGFPPYLKIYDSKIFRGRNTFKLTGAIDMTLVNFFRGLQIKGPEDLVIWKGMSLYWKQGESAIEGDKPLNQKVSVGFEAGAHGSEAKGDEPEESHIVLGPKVRF